MQRKELFRQRLARKAIVEEWAENLAKEMWIVTHEHPGWTIEYVNEMPTWTFQEILEQIEWFYKQQQGTGDIGEIQVLGS